MVGQAGTQPRRRHRIATPINTANATGGAGGSGGAGSPVCPFCPPATFPKGNGGAGGNAAATAATSAADGAGNGFATASATGGAGGAGGLVLGTGLSQILPPSCRPRRRVRAVLAGGLLCRGRTHPKAAPPCIIRRVRSRRRRADAGHAGESAPRPGHRRAYLRFHGSHPSVTPQPPPAWLLQSSLVNCSEERHFWTTEPALRPAR